MRTAAAVVAGVAAGVAAAVAAALAAAVAVAVAVAGGAVRRRRWRASGHQAQGRPDAAAVVAAVAALWAC